MVSSVTLRYRRRRFSSLRRTPNSWGTWNRDRSSFRPLVGLQGEARRRLTAVDGATDATRSLTAMGARGGKDPKQCGRSRPRRHRNPAAGCLYGNVPAPDETVPRKRKALGQLLGNAAGSGMKPFKHKNQSLTLTPLNQLSCTQHFMFDKRHNTFPYSRSCTMIPVVFSRIVQN